MGLKRTEDKEKQSFYRQINFFIMRYMWQVIRGKAKANGNNIYLDFEINRERYTRAIDTGRILVSKDEKNKLQERTGIRPEIFTGEVRFKLPNPNSKDSNTELITVDDWKQLFELRQARKNAHLEIEAKGDAVKVQYKYRNDDYLKKENKITKKLTELYNKDIDNTDFYYLCFYLENNKSVYKNQVYDKRVNDTMEMLNDLSFKILDGCKAELLPLLQKEMKSKFLLVQSIIQYKNASEAAKQSPS